MPIQRRIIVYKKDVMAITGVSERTARRWLAQVRKLHNKPAAALVTLDEFCAFTGIKIEQVIAHLH
jgi:hypothetical protein